MSPVDSFMQSVRAAFHPSDETPIWVWIAVAFCLLSIAAGTLIRSRRREQVAREAFARFLAGRKVTPAQVQLIDRLAIRAQVTVKSVATQIDVFERATALELGKQSPKPPGEEAAIYAEIAALRRALGFQQIAGHLALLTTRELDTGLIVQVAGVDATVVEVTEAFFAVSAPATSTIPIGAAGGSVRVTLVHGHEARYETRCVLLSKQPGVEIQKLIFAHDEQPTRIQLRKAVRVTVRGPVQLNQVGGGPAVKDESPAASDDKDKLGNGALLDISVGGAALDTTINVPVGSLVHLSFELEGIAYHDLLAFVLECQPRARGTNHMRLQFRNLAQSDEDQLAGSVARFSARPFAQQPSGELPKTTTE